MVDALVGLPQLLLDHALARIAPRLRLAGQIRPDICRTFGGGPSNTQRLFGLVGDRWIARNLRKPKAKMIPDTEAVCQTSEAAVDNGDDMYEKIKERAEKEVASVTAWKRYQRLVAAMESRGGEFNRKSLIEAIFRGSDLVYASH